MCEHQPSYSEMEDTIIESLDTWSREELLQYVVDDVGYQLHNFTEDELLLQYDIAIKRMSKE